jgi:hypothetical protein
VADDSIILAIAHYSGLRSRSVHADPAPVERLAENA